MEWSAHLTVWLGKRYQNAKLVYAIHDSIILNQTVCGKDTTCGYQNPISSLRLIMQGREP